MAFLLLFDFLCAGKCRRCGSILKKKMAQRYPVSEIADNIKKGKDKIIQVYDMLPNFCLSEEIPGLLDGLRNAMKDYVMLDTSHQDLKTSKQKVIQLCTEKAEREIHDGIKCSTLHEEINQLLKNTMSKELEKHSEGFLERDPLYVTMKDFNQTETSNIEDQEMDNEDGLAVTGETVQIIDPYSKREFSNPVKNSRCKHSYEKEIIQSLMAANKNTKCYWMGCNNRVPIRADDLVPDDELKRHITRMKARAAI